MGTLFILATCLLLGPQLCKSSAREIRSLTENSIDNSLEEWKAPKNIRQSFPIYVAGFDYEGRPVTVLEYGKWNMRKIVENGGEDFFNFEKYLNQSQVRFAQGNSYPPLHRQNPNRSENSGSAESYEEGAVLICDLEGFDLSQVTSVPTLTYVFGLSRKLAGVQDKLAYAYFINVNFLAERSINLSRPVLGRAMERIEVYGTNSAVWKPKLLRKIPPNQLPPWLGGRQNFKPVFIY